MQRLQKVKLLSTLGAFIALANQADAQDFFGPRVFLGTDAGYFMAYGGGGGALSGSSPNMFAWEEFEIFDLNGGSLVHGDIVALRTANTRQYISDNGGGVPVSADRPFPNPWEQFRVVRLAGAGTLRNGDRFALLGYHRLYMGPSYNFSDARVGCWADRIGSWETLRFIDKHDKTSTRSNCVEYARSRVPSLPRGMTTYQGKAAAINSWTPFPGSVAIMQIGTVGHVAVVEQVHGDGTVTVREANFVAGQVTSRRGRPQDMKIRGYFKPN